MKAYVGITDGDWFDLLRSRPDIEEVNFWQPSGSRKFHALQPGELFLFKLHSPRNFIVGYGIFAHFSLLPISIAWEAFGEANGAPSYEKMRARVEKYRRNRLDQFEDYTIGCILLEKPFFLSEEDWIPVQGWNPNIVQGLTYDLTTEPGLSMMESLKGLTGISRPIAENVRFGAPMITLPRLGQGSFRVIVSDAYERRCAVTEERTLPALDAAHIKPCSQDGKHEIPNGVLLRRDVHALFDRGYVTITTDLNLEVSRRIREEYENGRDYYRLHGHSIRPPENPQMRPSSDYLQWHNENVFRG